MDETLRLMLEEIRDDIKEIKESLRHQNGRIRKLEIWRGYITGGLAILAFLVGYLLKAM